MVRPMRKNFVLDTNVLLHDPRAIFQFADNTVIIFLSDNGYFLGDRGLADKWFMYEESIRVPCIVCDPRLPPQRRGRQHDAMVLNVDIAPTMLEMAGLPIPKGMQGRSLTPLLREAKAPADWRTEFFYEHHTNPKIIPPSEGVRTERWAGLVDAMAQDMRITRDEADTLASRSIPLGRIAECEEVACLVAYLASDLAHFVNGTMIEIDGGQQKPLMDRFRDR